MLRHGEVNLYDTSYGERGYYRLWKIVSPLCFPWDIQDKTFHQCDERAFYKFECEWHLSCWFFTLFKYDSSKDQSIWKDPFTIGLLSYSKKSILIKRPMGHINHCQPHSILIKIYRISIKRFTNGAHQPLPAAYPVSRGINLILSYRST